MILTILGFMTFFPFIHLLAVSFNDPLDMIAGGITFFPRKFSLFNYHYIFSNKALYLATVISILRTLVGTGLGVLFTAMIAYALSRREFMFRKSFNFIFVMTLYVNGGLIPTYLLIKNLGLMNSFWVYILPVLISAYNVIIMRSYFEQLPEAIVESAKMDGANEFQTLFRIILPISMPVVATITLFIGVFHWNSWFDNSLYNSRSPHLNLLQYELSKILMQSVTSAASSAEALNNNNVARLSPQSIRAALTIIVTFPILLIYPFLQKYFVKGITLAAVKE
ncbi:carbohydrate ABC transporter permease [Paenibacillus psychroresistens]|uniref:Carbohydrate ABC transporter permease n=1 Tax=Paenibacillus psychroresistens TaxID=1778678 RepID=A0A6B8RH70_9BACL|nr:carbohydrate ABC transporter permease [Paenibacillus psychroresistens]QGQ95540.1 carbohydrate ABC transporter permease [Paenibacillus psychroresistens]